MKRIGFTSFGTDHGKSGIGSYLLKLIPFFDASTEFEFEMIGPPEDADVYLKNTQNISFFPISEKWDPPIKSYVWHQYLLPKLCRKRRYDMLFLPAANRRLTGRAPCPAVGTVHDLASLHIAEKYDFPHRYFNTRMLPSLFDTLDAVITVSEYSKNDIVKFTHTAPELINVIHLAADLKDYYPRIAEKHLPHLKERYGIEAPYLLYISRIEHPGKNHIHLIKAFNIFKEKTGAAHSLVFTGPDKERSKEVHREAEKSPFADSIVFTGFADFEDIPVLYSCASSFILPSRFEGFGLPILEAMASGTLTASSNAASLPEVCGGHALLFDPENIEEIAETIIQLENMPENKKKVMKKQASDWAHSFSWDLTAQKTFDVFSWVVG